MEENKSVPQTVPAHESTPETAVHPVKEVEKVFHEVSEEVRDAMRNHRGRGVQVDPKSVS